MSKLFTQFRCSSTMNDAVTEMVNSKFMGTLSSEVLNKLIF
jgi:hypothetical protein